MRIESKTIPQKKMRDEKTLATFKIDKKHWLDFQALATANETNATRLLREFIAACLDGRIDFESLQPIEQPTFNIDEQITAALSPLLGVITGMKADIETLKTGFINQPKTVKKQPLQGTSTPSQVRTYPKENRTPSRASLLKPLLGMARDGCPKCNSSEIDFWGKGKLRLDGSRGQKVMCKICGKTSIVD